MRRLLVACAALLVAACGTTSGSGADPEGDGASRSSGPEVVVDRFVRALDRGDCAQAQSLVVTPALLGCDQVAQLEGSFAADGIDLNRVTYTAGRVHATSAVVSVDWGNGSPRESYAVERIAGDWLVVFDSEV